jgi:hypothetical protein
MSPISSSRYPCPRTREVHRCCPHPHLILLLPWAPGSGLVAVDGSQDLEMLRQCWPLWGRTGHITSRQVPCPTLLLRTDAGSFRRREELARGRMCQGPRHHHWPSCTSGWRSWRCSSSVPPTRSGWTASAFDRSGACRSSSFLSPTDVPGRDPIRGQRDAWSPASLAGHAPYGRNELCPGHDPTLSPVTG